MAQAVKRHMWMAVLVAVVTVSLFMYLMHDQTHPKTRRISSRLEPVHKQEEEHRVQRREVHKETVKELKKPVEPVQENHVPDALRGLYERQQRRSVDPES